MMFYGVERPCPAVAIATIITFNSGLRVIKTIFREGLIRLTWQGKARQVYLYSKIRKTRQFKVLHVKPLQALKKNAKENRIKKQEIK